MKSLKGLLAIFVLLTTSFSMANEKIIKIGIAGPFSGPNASFGDQLWQGASQAANDINQAGGVLGSKIELIQADDACEPKQAVMVANRLINDDYVTAVIGHFCSSSTLPAATIYANSEVLMITAGSTNPAITERGFSTIFRTCGRDDQQGIVAANFIHQTLKAKRVAIIHDKDIYGKGLADVVKAQLEKLGAHIVLYEGLTRGEKDFNALITKINSVNVDAIYFGGMHPEAGPLVRQLRQQRNEAPFISGDGIVSSEFVTSAGGPKMVKGVYMTFSSDPRTLAQSQKIVQEFREHHFEPEGYTLYSYATLQVIAAAINNTHSFEGAVLAKWLHQHSVPTILGEKSWDKKGDLKEANYVMYLWDDQGKYEPLSQPKK
ncbi:MAG: branched-chain amino acid ABC transporter substrate-binding protein [Candidatus Berkiellales bacterium]